MEYADADINVATDDGSTPMMVACFWGQFDMAKYLVERGSDARAPDKNGWTPFWSACYGGHLGIARWLATDIGIGDDITRAPTSGVYTYGTPLAIAKQWGYSTIVSWLSPFLMRRVLIAYWSVGRDRRRASLPSLGDTAEASHGQRPAVAIIAAIGVDATIQGSHTRTPMTSASQPTSWPRTPSLLPAKAATWRRPRRSLQRTASTSTIKTHRAAQR